MWTLWWVPGAILIIAGMIVYWVTTNDIGVGITGGGIAALLCLGVIARIHMTTFVNVGQSITIRPMAVNYLPAQKNYDVSFELSSKIYHASFSQPITVDPSLRSTVATAQHQTDGQGDSRYIVTSIQEPHPKNQPTLRE